MITPTGPDPVSPIGGAPADLPASMSRGEYLTRAADCAACHTRQGGLPYAGGRPFELPIGTIFSTNITSDPQNGIGRWTDDAFVKAVREGIGSKGHLYPAMPYTSYSRMSRADVLEIKKYLLSLQPVPQAAPENTLGFPFNQRWGMFFWNTAFFRERRQPQVEGHNATWHRGAYLADALGHCSECHTPRNLAFARKSGSAFAGSVTEGWKAYNITADKTDGIGAWTDDQIASYLRTGHAPGRSSAAGPMAEVVENSTQYLTPSDIKALVGYLRSVPARKGGEPGGTVETNPLGARNSNAVLPGKDPQQTSSRGARLFAGDCAGCHQYNGAGRQSNYANLTGSRAVNDPSGAALVQVLLHGTKLNVGGVEQSMPAFGATYSDTQIAEVANYVLTHFGSKTGSVTAGDVKKQRK
ncbi:alcohol dehydrogenase [Sphingobium lactosutens]|nr:alcohol dehydrogenase [Sphingobium lactosutens]